MHANVCKCRGHGRSHFKVRVIQLQWRLHSKSTTDGDNWPDRQQNSSWCRFTMGQIVKFTTLVKQSGFARPTGKMGVCFCLLQWRWPPANRIQWWSSSSCPWLPSSCCSPWGSDCWFGEGKYKLLPLSVVKAVTTWHEHAAACVRGKSGSHSCVISSSLLHCDPNYSNPQMCSDGRRIAGITRLSNLIV